MATPLRSAAVPLRQDQGGQPAAVSEPIRNLRRRLAIYQRSNAFDPAPPQDFTVERATTADDLEQAYRLTHDCFVEAGYIDPRPSGLHIRAFSALPHAAVFIAKAGGRVVGTQWMIADSPVGLPMDMSFSKELHALRAAGQRLIEASGISVAKEHRNLRVFTELTRCVMSYAIFVAADDAVTAISKEHSPFFEEILQFVPLGGPRSFSPEKEDIVVGQRLSFFHIEDKFLSVDRSLGEAACLYGFYFGSNPYTAKHAAWHERAQSLMKDPNVFRELFVEKAGLLERCSEKELRILQDHHPEADVLAMARARRARVVGQQPAVVRAFRRAAEKVPAYHTILAEAGVRPELVDSQEAYRRMVPVLDKTSTFGRFRVRDLCVDGDLGHLSSILPSSGHSGLFSFGSISAEDVERTTERIDAALDFYFRVQSRRTLLVNCLAMGVRVPSRAVTTVDTSVRADMVTAVVQSFAGDFEQTILVGAAGFIKKVLEDGQAAGFCWPKSLVHLVVGGESLAENCRTYLASLLGSDPDQGSPGLIISSMGTAELGLHLFFETQDTIAVRRRAHRDARLRSRLFSSPQTWCPMLFHYDPATTYVETVPGQEAPGDLLMSTLSLDARMPLLRYRTGDRGELLSAKKVEAVVAGTGEPIDHLGRDHFVAVYGRSRGVEAGGERLYPEAVKEGLYHDPELARRTTANFRIRGGGDVATVLVQAQPGVEPDGEMTERLAAAIRRYTSAPVAIQWSPYDQFGYQMALDYERKFAYLDV